MLAVCTPIHRQVEADFLTSLFATMQAGGPDVRWLNTIGHANLARARNYLVQEARDRGAEAIVFIDSDIGWDVNAFSALFDADESVRVLGGSPQRREDKLAFCSIPDHPVAKTDGRLITGKAATAFLRVDTSVFDELEAKVPHYAYKDRQYPAFFQIGIRDGYMLDEDVWFSQLCRDNGIEVWLDPTIPLRHWHSQPLTAVMADHMKFTPLKEAV